MYQLTITEHVENPDFEKELEDYTNRSRYANYDLKYPKKYVEKQVLSAKVEEKQFEAIRKAALEVF